MHKSTATLLREYHEAREALERRKAEEFPPGAKVVIPSVDEEYFEYGDKKIRAARGQVTCSISDPDKVTVALKSDQGFSRSFPIEEVERL
jgi:hypothetical protein